MNAGVSDPFNLQRFVEAQQGTFERALAELRAGSKKTHWMWFIFPQMAGLGRSSTATFYAIKSIDEARAYLAHPLLRKRLHQCVDALLVWSGSRSAEQILGSIDALKLRSSLTLFEQVEPGASFAHALAAFYAGQPDARTLALLNAGA
jgi:uncharacterized protein (DUF1810 family)